VRPAPAQNPASPVPHQFIFRIAGRDYPIAAIALVLMLAGILLPTATYSFRLTDPTPTDLLVAVCLALFSAVVYLWILDATSLLRFRSAWVSRSVYGAAIVSVLGTSVAVYKDYFEAPPHPYEGAWELQIATGDGGAYLLDEELVLTFSEAGGYYWGFTKANLAPVRGRAVWAEVVQFTPNNNNVIVRLFFPDGSEKVLRQTLLTVKRGGSMYSSRSDSLLINLSRRR